MEEGLAREAFELVKHSREASTISGYKTGWNHWLAFCQEFKYSNVYMSYAAPNTRVFRLQSRRLSFFVTFLDRRKIQADTVSAHVNAVMKHHERRFFSDVLRHHKFHRLLIDGIKRRNAKEGKFVARKLPFTWDLVTKSRKFLNPHNFQDSRMFAALKTGVAFLLRASELLPGTRHSIRRNSVRFTWSKGEVTAVTIVIHSSKTSSTPVSKTLANDGPDSVCQVLYEFLSMTRGLPSDPLFAGLSYTKFNSDLKDLGVLLGIKDAKTKLASQSLRRGGATSLFNAGIDAMYIREWGRWSQDMWVTVYAQLSFDRQLELTKAFPSVM